MALNSSSKPYVCQYCNTGYTRESTLIAHMCEPKRRALQKDEKRVQLGLYAFNRFYLLGTNAKKEKSYEEFCKSPYYNAFVKFGSFVNNVRPLYPEKYIDYIVVSGIKIEKWCDEKLYEKYAVDLIKKEDVHTALERSINTMTDWANDNTPAPWNHYFKYVSLNRAAYHIKDGKMSPWLVLNCSAGKELLNKFNEEQLSMIYHIMDPEHWARVFKSQPSNLKLVNLIVEQSKM